MSGQTGPVWRQDYQPSIRLGSVGDYHHALSLRGRGFESRPRRMSTSRVGDESEALALSRLMSLGLSVSVPFGDNDRYDLVVDDGDTLYRVQVKTGRVSGSTVNFKCRSCTTVNGETQYNEYTSDEIDAYVVCCSERDEVYWVPIEDAGTSQMDLRFEGNLSHSRVNSTKDYLLTERFI